MILNDAVISNKPAINNTENDTAVIENNVPTPHKQELKHPPTRYSVIDGRGVSNKRKVFTRGCDRILK